MVALLDGAGCRRAPFASCFPPVLARVMLDSLQGARVAWSKVAALDPCRHRRSQRRPVRTGGAAEQLPAMAGALG
jgi:hypothetical protein